MKNNRYRYSNIILQKHTFVKIERSDVSKAKKPCVLNQQYE